MTITTKIISATATLGLVGGTSYTISHFLSGETLGKTLENKGYQLLSFDVQNKEGKTTWDAIIKDYLKGTNKFKNLTITLQGSASPTEDDVKKIKEECQKIVSLKKYNDSDLLLAEQYCITPINIKELLKKQKYSSLNTDENDSQDKDKWDAKVTNYVQKGSKNAFSGIELTSSKPSDAKERRNVLRKACKPLEIINTHAPSFHSDYSKFKEWCAIEETKK